MLSQELRWGIEEGIRCGLVTSTCMHMYTPHVYSHDHTHTKRDTVREVNHLPLPREKQ